MGELVEMVERLCPRSECRKAGFVCPVIVQLARETELLWERVNELRRERNGQAICEGDE